MVEPRSQVAGAVAVLVAALGMTVIAPPAPRFVWNVSASAPPGLYRLEPDRLPAAGDWAALRTPEPARTLAAVRHYLPANVPLVKRVAARGGQRVCTRGDRLTIDGALAAVQRHRDGKGRPLPHWRACRLLGPREFLVLGEAHDSFDSRYFGPVDQDAILGRAVPLWTR